MEGLFIFLICLVVVAVIVVVMIISYFIVTKNKFIKMQEDIKNSSSRIDVYLTKRFDDITKLVDTIKGYTKHENETLTSITEMRSKLENSNTMQEKAAFASELDSKLAGLKVIVENYPDLKADKLFLRLQDEISEIEENLQAARSNYNLNVSAYNKAIKVFPGRLVAKDKYKEAEYFEVEETKKDSPKINF